MKVLVLTAVCFALATSVSANNKYFRANAPLPSEVEQNLPADIPARDVLVQDGCFFYLFEGEVFPVAQPETPNQPICAG